ncbi:MAG: 3-phosphoshikimate 1-carboxyvinyltransferase [Lentisphaeria bacterium]
MKFHCRQSQLQGTVDIPGSKSHTIRALVLAALADGESVIETPLVSADTLSAVAGVEAFGAKVDRRSDNWVIQGAGPRPQPVSKVIDVGNSGTTLRILMGMAALMPEDCEITLTGDEQIQKRPAGPLLQALNDLGAHAVAVRDNGCAPYKIRGRIRGGRTEIEAKSSQYLSSLLIACPLAPDSCTVDLSLLYERRYVEMTLWWLRNQGIELEHKGLEHFNIPGGQTYRPVNRRIPADFSSATFFFGGGALNENEVVCRGLDMADTQGDKAVLDYLRQMGAEVEVGDDAIRVVAAELSGCTIDMNDTPDALPVMAVLGCFAEGKTVLHNVAHARLKETDRIKVMAAELGKMGGRLEEMEDGLVIYQSELRGAVVDGHGDHRVVMALALAGFNSPGPTTIDTAEAVNITFPDFAELMRSIGGDITTQ